MYPRRTRNKRKNAAQYAVVEGVYISCFPSPILCFRSNGSVKVEYSRRLVETLDDCEEDRGAAEVRKIMQVKGLTLSNEETSSVGRSTTAT